jgi:F0F1-type ATP synthase, subunit a
MMERLTIIKGAAIAASLVFGVLFLCLRGRKKPAGVQQEDIAKKQAKKRRLLLILGVFWLWLCCGLVIGLFSQESEGLRVEMTAPRVELFGVSISSSVVISWGAMLVLIVLALIIRIFVVPRFKETPKGIQSVLETIVEYISSYTKEKSGIESNALNSYMLTLALFLTACGLIELFSFRPPTADIATTLSLALVTFVMINYYGIKKKGIGGRIASLAKPTPIVFPFRLLSDIAIPVSLACRLFGNMLGGMIVVHLVYMALGTFGVGIPAVLGLYFNVFHPLIQVFIFITLSLTFIGEAVE